MYFDLLSDITQETFLIDGPGHSSEHFKVINDFGTRYAKGISFKNSRHEPNTKKRLINKKVNYMVQNEVDNIPQDDKVRKLRTRLYA